MTLANHVDFNFVLRRLSILGRALTAARSFNRGLFPLLRICRFGGAHARTRKRGAREKGDEAEQAEEEEEEAI